MRRPRALAATGVAALVALSCSGGSGSAAPDPKVGVEVVRAESVLDFHRRATDFYRLLEGRRFNSLVTFRDPALRDYFQSETAFSDYYADLAQVLADAHFERNRPLRTTVEEFLVEAAGRARVRVRIGGQSGLPLRWWSTAVVREDRWERVDGRWWIVPGRL